jgi:hypothetical protein
VTAADAESGLAVDPSEVVSVDTSHVGPQTVVRTAVDNVGHETTGSCTTQVVYPDPGAPHLTGGSTPNPDGLFTLGWTGDDPLRYVGLAYTLQHHDAATPVWSTVAGEIGALSYAFEGAGEQEGTWVYRVQGSDPGHGQTTAYSPDSSPVVVDRTAPFPPAASVSRPPDYAGNGGWYKDSVTVSFGSFVDPNLSDGSTGSGIDPASIPTSQTVATSGSHLVCATVADRVGNVSAPGCRIVQVEATPPTLEIECPQTALVGSSASAKVVASDPYSGLQVDPSGTVAIDTSHAGTQTTTRTAISYLGFESTKSCDTTVQSSTPGAPALTAGSNPNRNGRFTLGWSGPDPLQYFGLTYTLQHHDAASATWSSVARNIPERGYEFSGGGEEEGTWVYRVQASDASIGLTSEYSPASEPVVVDRTPPNTPTAVPARAPDFAGGGGWYDNGVTVSFNTNGDPPLADGSPGSGVEPASLTAPETFSASGTFTASGTVADKAGNRSAAVMLTVKVDATPPALDVTCPSSAQVGETGVAATVTASDAESGLSSDPSGTVPISTAQPGPVTVTRTAVDNVGHETSRSCTTQVRQSPPEFGRCVSASEVVGGKKVGDGFFTNAGCTTEGATQTNPYEYLPGVLKTSYSTAMKVSTKVVFETTGRQKVTCTGESGTGTITTDKTVGGVVMRFTGCFVAEELCTTPGHAAGELVTRTLEGALGIERIVIKEGKEKRYAGLDLYPSAKAGAFLEYTCGTRSPVTLTGSVIAPVPTDVMFSEGLMKYSAGSGRQKPESFLGGEKDVLVNNHGEQVGLAASLELKNPERLEINAFF